MPPSADDLPGRKPPRRERRAAERTARKRGKRPGAPGSAMSWAEPDEVRDHYPRGACGCGADLADAADLGQSAPTSSSEIPAPSALRMQHDLHQVRYACGAVHVADRPAGTPCVGAAYVSDCRLVVRCENWEKVSIMGPVARKRLMKFRTKRFRGNALGLAIPRSRAHTICTETPPAHQVAGAPAR